MACSTAKDHHSRIIVHGFIFFTSMSSSPDSVGRGILFSGCPSAASVQFSPLPQYLANALDNFDKTNREYSLAPTDDLVRFWGSKVKAVEVAAKSIF